MAASAPPPPDKLEGGGGPAPPPAPPSTGRKQGKAGESAEEGRGLEKPGTWGASEKGWAGGESGVLRPRGLRRWGVKPSRGRGRCQIEGPRVGHSGAAWKSEAFEREDVSCEGRSSREWEHDLLFMSHLC